MMDQIVKHIPCYCAHATNVRFCCVKDQGQQVGEGGKSEGREFRGQPFHCNHFNSVGNLKRPSKFR
ncbi:unnamed protein product [Prunus armeniaca]